MNQQEFQAWRAKCSRIVEAYLSEVRKTERIAAQCDRGPLPFQERFALLSQEIAEQDAYANYLEAKRLLHRAAVLGYDVMPPTLPGSDA